MTFRRYRYDNTPSSLPLSDDEPAWDDTLVIAAGFKSDDEEVSLATLGRDWNGHPAGSLVVTGLQVEGHLFAILTPDNESPQQVHAQSPKVAIAAATGTPIWWCGVPPWTT